MSAANIFTPVRMFEGRTPDLIVAVDRATAERVARHYGLQPLAWRYAVEHLSFAGIPRSMVWLVEGWHLHPDATKINAALKRGHHMLKFISLHEINRR